ncbi:MAG TPA: MltA domain-containing protein [Casimicrobiaceae bacterium]|nr:MltA domain-containing protein [Casimicrobiaceae bacterium]
MVRPLTLVSVARSATRAAGALAAACLLLSACQTIPTPPAVAPSPAAPVVPAPAPAPAPPPRPVFTPSAWADVPGWKDDTLEAAWPAFVIGCRALLADAKTQPLWQQTCADSAFVDANSASSVRTFFETHFIPYRVASADGKDVGRVTGYYEPLLKGSRTRTPQFDVPLYAAPDDLLTVELSDLFPELKDKRVRGRVDGRKVVPYWTRAEIEHGAWPLQASPLVFVADPVEAFYFEIQGSGRIELADGSVLRLGYADQNGHPYKSIARVLIDRGDLPRERASMAGISAWAKAHPEQTRALLDENPSFVFFREVPPAAPGSLEATIDGPIGTLGVPLLAQRTIAVDPRAIPLGAPVFLATTLPLSKTPLERLVMAQDTGGAIRGAVRADYFWGFGPQSGREAGRMLQDGRMWLLWPKGAELPQ